MIRKTYNEIIQYLELFSSEHLDIFRFVAEQEEQMSEQTTKEELFPMLFVSPITNLFDYQIDEIRLKVFCYDRLMKDRSNIINAQSRTSQILNDLNVWLREESALPFELSFSTNVYPMNSSLMTDVAGWYMEITLSIPSYTICEIPFKNKPIMPINVCKK